MGPTDDLFGQCHNVALQSCGVCLIAISLIDLMKIAAHAKEDAAGAGGSKEVVMEFVAGLLQVFHAISFGKDAPQIEGIDE